MKSVAKLVACLLTLHASSAGAQQVAAQVTLRNRQQLNLVWDNFSEQEVRIFHNAHVDKLFIPNGRKPLQFDSLPASAQQNIRWAAEEAGIAGNLEQAIAGRYDAARPLTLRMLVGEGTEANQGGRRWHIPLSSVAQIDRGAFQATFLEWSEKRAEINREQERVRALNDVAEAARAAEYAAWAAVRAANRAANEASSAAHAARSAR